MHVFNCTYELHHPSGKTSQVKFKGSPSWQKWEMYKRYQILYGLHNAKQLPKTRIKRLFIYSYGIVKCPLENVGLSVVCYQTHGINCNWYIFLYGGIIVVIILFILLKL